MGTRGPIPKQDATRVRSPAPVTVAASTTPGRANTGTVARIPPVPKGLLPVTRREWRTFWDSEVRQVLARIDVPVVERLFRYRDEWHRVTAVAYTPEGLPRLSLGSTGQETLHPYIKRLDKLEDLMGGLEKELGIAPMARARLGVKIGTAALTWQQVMAGQNGGGEDTGGTGTAPGAVAVDDLLGVPE